MADIKKLHEILVEVLKSDSSFVDSATGKLDYVKIIDSAEKIDETLITLLADNHELKEKFFIKIKNVYVFKINDFRFFIEEHKVDNSYTAYKNRIGLTDGKRFLKDTNDVVLDFPYKDCVLEGGQSTEEGKDTYFEKNKDNKYEQKKAERKEIFFNQVLAHDEIDRLFDPKALVNWKRYTKDGEEAVQEIKRDEEGTIKENLIIKGNNLLALHSLKKQFAGKVKLIYIDPPYNTRSDKNAFKYNNSFKHSTWLTFMKNRMEIGKLLLNQDGVMIIAIDENEQVYLGCLIKEIFPEEIYENHCVAIVHNPRGIIGKNFSYTHEFAYFILPKDKAILGKRKIEKENIEYNSFRNWGGESLRTDAQNCFYSILVDKCTQKIIDFGEVCDDNYRPPVNIHKNDFVEIYPVDKNGTERKWRYARQSVENIKDSLKVTVNNKGIYDIQIGKDFGTIRTVWVDKKYDANEYGTKLINKLVPENTFSFPKSLWSVFDCIKSVTENDKDAIILDFFGGSGTTAHAVLALNKEDGGNRKFIVVEQMNYINTVTYPRVQKVMQQENINDSFIYFELAQWNESAKEKILACKSIEELIKFFDTMYEQYFLNYNLKIKKFKEKVIKEEAFKNLTLDEQKKMFVVMLDNNQMYVHKTEMEDKKFGISENDQKLTEVFYNKK